MEQILVKLFEISTTAGIAVFIIWGFFIKKINEHNDYIFKKLDERDAYLKELIEELRAIIDQDNLYKERLNESLLKVKKEVEILNDKLDNLL